MSTRSKLFGMWYLGLDCFAKWYQQFLSNILRIVEIEGEKETELCNTETGEIGDIEAFVKQKSIEMMADFHGAGKPPHYIGERLPDNSIVSEIFFEDIGNHHSVMAWRIFCIFPESKEFNIKTIELKEE